MTCLGWDPPCGSLVVFVAALALAGCGDSSSSTDATTASTTAASSDGTATGDGTTASSGSMTTAGPGGSETQGMSTSSASATGTGTTGQPTGTSATSSTTGPDTSSSGPTSGTSTTTESTGGETDGGGACGVADGDYGPCEALIGWAFDGEQCVHMSGCGCEPDCDLFFDTQEACVGACADAGQCNPDKFTGVYLADKLELGEHCDQVDICTPPDLLDALGEVFDYDCAAAQYCDDGEMACTVSWAGPVSMALYDGLCEMSLYAGIHTIACVIFGP